MPKLFRLIFTLSLALGFQPAWAADGPNTRHVLDNIQSVCKEVRAVSLERWIVGTLQHEQSITQRTEIHFKGVRRHNGKDISVDMIVTFHEAEINKNVARCRAGIVGHVFTIPLDYGQLPAILKMWEIAEASGEKLGLSCVYGVENGGNTVSAGCHIFGIPPKSSSN